MGIAAKDFDYFRELLVDKSGIVLDDGKEYLVESRLLSLIRGEGFASLDELFARLRSEVYNGLHVKAIEAMTTNETSFFRDLHPFQALKESIMPELCRRRAEEKAVTIWCGAASSGQEPYTILMTLEESFPELKDWTVRLIATDLSVKMLDRTREGIFSQLEVNRGLPAKLLVKYFQKSGAKWQIKKELRDRVEVKQMNLTSLWPAFPPMDIVFMRNVLIYFDIEMKKEILGKIRRLLRPDGYLLLGGTETTINLDDNYERVAFANGWCYKLRA